MKPLTGKVIKPSLGIKACDTRFVYFKLFNKSHKILMGAVRHAHFTDEGIEVMIRPRVPQQTKDWVQILHHSDPVLKSLLILP